MKKIALFAAALIGSAALTSAYIKYGRPKIKKVLEEKHKHRLAKHLEEKQGHMSHA